MDLEFERENVPLMNELHELGLRHGVRMVVVARPMNRFTSGDGVRALLIDHRNETTVADAQRDFMAAGLLLMQAAVAMSKEPQKPAPADSP